MQESKVSHFLRHFSSWLLDPSLAQPSGWWWWRFGRVAFRVEHLKLHFTFLTNKRCLFHISYFTFLQFPSIFCDMKFMISLVCLSFYYFFPFLSVLYSFILCSLSSIQRSLKGFSISYTCHYPASLATCWLIRLRSPFSSAVLIERFLMSCFVRRRTLNRWGKFYTM